MGSGKDRRWVFTNEIPHQTAVKAEQLHNQANRVSRVDSTSGCEGPTLGYWVIHPGAGFSLSRSHIRFEPWVDLSTVAMIGASERAPHDLTDRPTNWVELIDPSTVFIPVTCNYRPYVAVLGRNWLFHCVLWAIEYSCMYAACMTSKFWSTVLQTW